MKKPYKFITNRDMYFLGGYAPSMSQNVQGTMQPQGLVQPQQTAQPQDPGVSEIGGDAAGLLGGAASGDMMGTATKMLDLTTEEVEGQMSVWNNENASTGQKIFAGLGSLAGPLGGKFTSGIVNKNLEAQQAKENAFTGGIQGRNKMMGLALGGQIPGMQEQGLNEFNGNSHEMGGIPITPNAEVQGGETKSGNYIYSDDLKIGKNPLLPKSIWGKTHAEGSKKLHAFSEQRPNSPITKESLLEMDKRLQADNDRARTEVEASQELEMRCGGRMYYNGGKIKEGEYDMEDISQEEIEFLQSQGYDVEY